MPARGRSRRRRGTKGGSGRARRRRSRCRARAVTGRPPRTSAARMTKVGHRSGAGGRTWTRATCGTTRDGSRGRRHGRSQPGPRARSNERIPPRRRTKRSRRRRGNGCPRPQPPRAPSGPSGTHRIARGPPARVPARPRRPTRATPRRRRGEEPRGRESRRGKPRKPPPPSPLPPRRKMLQPRAGARRHRPVPAGSTRTRRWLPNQRRYSRRSSRVRINPPPPTRTKLRATKMKLRATNTKSSRGRSGCSPRHPRSSPRRRPRRRTRWRRWRARMAGCCGRSRRCTRGGGTRSWRRCCRTTAATAIRRLKKKILKARRLVWNWVNRSSSGGPTRRPGLFGTWARWRSRRASGSG